MAHLAKMATSDFRVKGNDKFIYVSESTLPVKPFNIVYRELTATNSSDVGISSVKAAPGYFHDKEVYLMKHSQWMVLNRRHAHLFGNNWKGFIKAPPFWTSPFDT